MSLKLPPAICIESDEALVNLVKQLKQEPLIAVDTESNNLYAYHGQVCLIQLSTRKQDYIIDPLAIADMQPFGQLLADEAIEKIFHAAEYDLISLNRDYEFEVHNLFDTMYAARLCRHKPFGLADLLKDFFSVRVDKRHQLDDWGKRPLPKDSLRYAQMDTHFLIALRDQLRDQLLELERLEEAQEVFADVLRIEAKAQAFDPDGYWKIGRPKSLSRRQMARLRELYLLRERLAQEEDLPPFKVFTNKALIRMAEQRPKSFKDLYNVREINARQVRVYGDLLLEAIEKGNKKRLPPPPEPDLPDPIIADRYVALHAWRKGRGIQRGIDSNLVLSKQTLWDLAREMPKDKEDLAAIEGIGDWRVQMYGDEILELIATLR